jgi:hypothetical protein
MKKTLLLVLCLLSATFLAACGSTWTDGNVETGDALANIYGKTSLTLEDIDLLEINLLPKSYNYNIVEEWVETSSWTIKYPEIWNNERPYLIPIDANAVSRELLSSTVEDWYINTNVLATQPDWDVVLVLYVNDPETMKFVLAGVNSETYNISYRFQY